MTTHRFFSRGGPSCPHAASSRRHTASCRAGLAARRHPRCAPPPMVLRRARAPAAPCLAVSFQLPRPAAAAPPALCADPRLCRGSCCSEGARPTHVRSPWCAPAMPRRVWCWWPGLKPNPSLRASKGVESVQGGWRADQVKSAGARVARGASARGSRHGATFQGRRNTHWATYTRLSPAFAAPRHFIQRTTAKRLAWRTPADSTPCTPAHHPPQHH